MVNMKNIYFISDLHLQSSEPKIVHAFLHFLTEYAAYAECLYILGDFFEAWIGDDDNTPLVKQIKAALQTLTAQGIPVYFMHGNRDFLIGQRFAKETGVQLLADPTLLNLYGKKILLMHGDLLCIDDQKYQQFRKKAHDPKFQKRILRLPLLVRRLLAGWARYKSKKHTGKTNLMLQDVNQPEVLRVMQQHDVDILIHGHTHRPAIHDIKLNHKNAQRIVLAAWHDEGHYLCLDANGKFITGSLPALSI
jgi:UDP-2,3-diacylglucosamine hydrolase